jgi:heat shock protein HslJ
MQFRHLLQRIFLSVTALGLLFVGFALGCMPRADGETALQKASTRPALEHTYWKLTRLGDQPVQVAAEQREPHMILNSESRRIGGSGGCNRLIGGYELEGDRLAFVQLAMTRMACPQGMETEDAFLVALEKVKTWRILGQYLELYDTAGNLLARFEAKPME